MNGITNIAFNEMRMNSIYSVRVFIGQGGSTDPTRFVKTRQLLQGEVINSFESHVAAVPNHSET